MSSQPSSEGFFIGPKMTKLKAILATLFLSSLAFGQGQRFDTTFWTTTPINGVKVLAAVSPATVNVCSKPASGVPCTNKATTYTDATLGTACPSNAQLVLNGTSTCVATSDSLGNIGGWLPSGPENYQYTITVSGHSYGPYDITGDGNAVHRTGDETIRGNKHFTGNATVDGNFAAGSTLITQQGRVAAVVSTATSTSLPHVMAKLRSAINPTINVALSGSSVMCGASLSDPDNQAPGVYFANSLKAKLDPWGNATWNVYNYCQNGSVVYGFSLSVAAGYTKSAWQTMLDAGVTPDVVWLGYVMNDAQPAAFNAGQTRSGFQTALQQAITKVQEAGADVVVATSPHPAVITEQSLRGGAFWTLPASVDQTYPTAISKPVSATATTPAYPGTGSNTALVTADTINNGGPSVTVDRRFTIINQDMRSIAAEAGVPVVDAEKYAIRCMQKQIMATGSQLAAEAVLFNSGQIVHPNLTYDQCSYYEAIDDFTASVGRAVNQSGTGLYHRGYFQFNGDSGKLSSPLAGLDAHVPPYPDSSRPSFLAWARTGTADGDGIKAEQKAVFVDPSNGDLVTSFGAQEGYRFHAPTTYGTGSFDYARSYSGVAGAAQAVNHLGAYNVSAGGTVNIPVTHPSAGKFRISSYNNGEVLGEVYENTYYANDSGICLGINPTMNLVPRGSWASKFTIGLSGYNLVINNVTASTNYSIRVEQDMTGDAGVGPIVCPGTDVPFLPVNPDGSLNTTGQRDLGRTDSPWGKVFSTSGSTNHAVCWKSDKSIGYCSAVVATDGTCGTCN